MTPQEIQGFDFSETAWEEICRVLQVPAGSSSLRLRLRLAAWNYLAAIQFDRQTLPDRKKRWNTIAKTARKLSGMLIDADAVVGGREDLAALQASLRHLHERASLMEDAILETIEDADYSAPENQRDEPRRNLVKASLDVFVEMRRTWPTANKPTSGGRYTGEGFTCLWTITKEVMGDDAPAPDTVVRWVKQYTSQTSEI